MKIPPASKDYMLSCDPTRRTYIDIDEDTLFTVTPNILWIEDVDSNEAIEIAKRGRVREEEESWNASDVHGSPTTCARILSVSMAARAIRDACAGKGCASAMLL